MANLNTYTLTVVGYNITDAGFYGWNMVGEPTTELSELFDILEHLVETGQVTGGCICSNSTGEVVGKVVNGKILVAV